MAKQQTRTQQRPAPAAAQFKEESTDTLPAINAPRLPYHPAIEQRFGLDKSAWKVLVESTWPSARTPDSVILALSYCKARNLDPFKRPVHIVPITVKKTIDGKDAWVEIETVWPAISETRTTAFRTKDYAGMDPPTFGPTKTFHLMDQEKSGSNYVDVPIDIDAPEWCQVTVHRLVGGVARPFPGPRVYWQEFYAPRNRFVTAPNEQWKRKPSYMLEKCAEATSLRRAFPEEYGDAYAIEELGSLGHLRTVGGSATFGAGATEPERKPTPEPRRGDFEQTNKPAKAAAAGAQEEPPPAEDPRGDAPQTPQENGTAPAESEAGRGPHAGAHAGESDPAAGDPARVPEGTIGQDAVIAWIEKAIDDAPDVAAVDRIMEANADKIAKIGDLKRSALLKRADDMKRMVA